MTSIEKRHVIDSNNLSDESYFISILKEATIAGLLNESQIEYIQMQCMQLLAAKSERYNRGESSSIRVETAESIMKSNLYTIGLYLKSLPDPDSAMSEVQGLTISEIYQKGRELIKAKFGRAEQFYELVQKNKIYSLNDTYNATIDHSGIGAFFKSYNPDYEAHETPANIDYQLCNPVPGVTGVEYMEKYLESLFLENEFCSHFAQEDIHHLLCGYDGGYQDLLINIYEQVLTGVLGCRLANRSVLDLDMRDEEIQRISEELSKDDDHLLALKVQSAFDNIIEELKLANPLLCSYIEKSQLKIISSVIHGVKTNTLDKVFVVPVNPDLQPKIQFLSGVKMQDEDYRKLIDELLICRYSSDKIGLIKEKVKSFGDMEDILFDARLSEEEAALVFELLGDMEIAALSRRHPFKTDIQAVDLSEDELAFRLALKSYIEQLPPERQERIYQLEKHLIDSD